MTWSDYSLDPYGMCACINIIEEGLHNGELPGRSLLLFKTNACEVKTVESCREERSVQQAGHTSLAMGG